MYWALRGPGSQLWGAEWDWEALKGGGHWDVLGSTGKYWVLRGPLVSMGRWVGLGSIEVGEHWDVLGAAGSFDGMGANCGALGGIGKH